MAEQTQQPTRADPRTNRLLARLEQEDYKALMRVAQVVPLKFRKRLLRQDERVDAVYFPLTCMISLLVTAGDKPQMEMATIGREGVVGASEPSVRARSPVGGRFSHFDGKSASRRWASARALRLDHSAQRHAWFAPWFSGFG
jgi:hypothetical protein